MFGSVWKIMRENKFQIEISEISDDLICIICNELMINACSAPCGCRFCSDCIENYLNGIDKFCPGKLKYCQKKMINYANDLSSDNAINVRISDIVVNCPIKHCQFKDELGLIENHMKSCDKLPISCPYHEIGCEKIEVMIDEMKDHLNENNYYHNKLLIDLINNLRNEIESIKNKIIELKTESNEFKQKINNFDLQYADQSEKICDLERKESGNLTEIVALKNENKSLKSEIYKNVQSINEFREIIHIIQTQSQSQMQQINLLKENYEKKEDNKKAEMLKGTIDKICDQNVNFVTKLDNHDESFKQIIESKIKNLEIKMIDMETNSENDKIFGEFKWKIKKLSQQQKDKRIYSKPFYSEKSGYKMCLSVIIVQYFDVINVDFHIMNGKFDDNLSWPFKYKVIVDVINQENGKIFKSKIRKYSSVHDGWNKPLMETNYKIWFYGFSIKSSPVKNDQVIFQCRLRR